MNKLKFISLFVLIFASCNKSWQGVTDGDYDDFNGGSPVPVLVGVGDSGLSYTREAVRLIRKTVRNGRT